MNRTAIALLLLSCTCGTASAQSSGRAPIEPSAPGPIPNQASDIDTVKLASAHREKAQSMDERTNGLWQSWLVSVCEGCGSLPPAAQHVQAIARRDAETSRRGAPLSDKRSTQNDLSNEALDRIRSTPRE